jgi:hypothetical protein
LGLNSGHIFSGSKTPECQKEPQRQRYENGELRKMLPQYTVTLNVENKDGSLDTMDFEVERLANARFTARDREGMRQLLNKWSAEGHERLPVENPAVCFSSRYLLTNGDAIEVQGGETSGEVEFVVYRLNKDQYYISVGSDHCDRSWLDRMSQEKPKQMCPRVISTHVWPYEDIKDHWDDLILRSWVIKNGERQLYQDSPVSTQCAIETLFEIEPLIREDGVVLMGGTVDELIGFVYEDEFEMELYDPVLDRSIKHSYTIHPLPSDERWLKERD